jgi:hypothetical protein
MTDTPSNADGIVILGAPAPEKQPSFMPSKEILSPLNLCFLGTSIGGAFSEWVGSPGLAVLCMLAFIIYGCAKRKSIDLERFADAAYYQGFILTLFALLLALTGKGTQTITSDGIIAQFGLAIWTTFTGMSARIVIIQFFVSASDQEDEARESIAQYVTQLNDEIGNSLSQIRLFREKVLESATKINDDLAEEAKRSRKESTDAIKAAMAALVRSVEQTTAKLDTAVEKVTLRISELDLPEDALSGPLARLAETLSGDLNLVKTELEQGARDFAGTMKANVAVLESARSDLGQLRVAIGQVNETVSAASQIASDAVAGAQANLATASSSAKGVEQLGRTAEALALRLTQLSGALDGKGRSYAESLDRASAENKAVNDELANTVAAGVQKIAQAVRNARVVDGESK